MACGSLVCITWSGIGNGIGVAGCYWWGFGTCCGIGWGGWGQEVVYTSFMAQTHIHHNN